MDKYRQTLSVAAIAVLLLSAVWIATPRSVAAPTAATVIPAPALDVTAPANTGLQIAVFAGGCFWGVQGVYQHTKGVRNAVSGYAGGDKQTATYKAITTGRTGHAESVEVTFDPSQITYGKLLHVLFSVVHDPTQLNRQGPDIGTHYRSAIFPRSPEQAQIAKAYIAQLNQARVFPSAIVTKIEFDREFFPAEDYHQDYMVRNPTQPYIVHHDLPKVEDLKRVFPDLYRNDPVLVANAGRSN